MPQESDLFFVLCIVDHNVLTRHPHSINTLDVFPFVQISLHHAPFLLSLDFLVFLNQRSQPFRRIKHPLDNIPLPSVHIPLFPIRFPFLFVLLCYPISITSKFPNRNP